MYYTGCMKQTGETLQSEKFSERGWRFYRNWNILGALALGSVALLWPGPNPLLAAGTGLNVAQAGVGEVFRSNAEKRRKRKT